MIESLPRSNWVVALALLADATAVIALIATDIQRGPVILLASVATLICASGASLILYQRNALVARVSPDRYVAHLSEAFHELEFGNASSIYCLASGTETYYGLIESRLRDGTIRRGVVLHIGYRVGSSVRTPKLAEYGEKWRLLGKKWAVDIQFYPVDDFDHALRGVVVDDAQGAVGFYFRRDEQTIGGDSAVIVVERSSDVGRFLIDSFREVFACRKAESAIADSVRPRLVN